MKNIGVAKLFESHCLTLVLNYDNLKSEILKMKG
jgi:hypothetical protein